MDHIFPDEIFLQIFRYLPILDLFRGFYNLNSHLNHIIGEVRIHIPSLLNEEEQRYILPNIRPQQIRSLYVSEEKYEFSNLKECVNIRTLEFGCISRYNSETYVHRQLAVVQPTIFPHLRKLTIYQQSWTPEYKNLCTMIFGNQFPVLKYLYLPYANGSCTSGIKTWSTSLTSVRIECCNKSMLYSLLDNLPNLKGFTCTLGTNEVRSLKNQCLALKCLNMTTYDQGQYSNRSMMKFEEMNNLYRCLPNLERTIVMMHCPGTIDDALDHLHGVLSHCQNLKSVDCHIKYTWQNSPQASFDEIKDRYPLFTNYRGGTWKERNGYGCRIRKDD
jgi:hypothetical protein